MTLRLPATALMLVLLAPPGSAQPVTRNVDLKSHWDEYTVSAGFSAKYSACWSYIHEDGREYAVIGTAEGTAIYNVTDPVASYRVGFIAGPLSSWREMKSYRNWIYVVSEGFGPAEGLQIVSMVDPEIPVLVATDTMSFHRAHTVSIDTTRALLVCNGTRKKVSTSGYFPSGVRILSLANPEAPVEVGTWPGGPLPVDPTLYVHDSVPIGNRLYASTLFSGPNGAQRVIDITSPAAPFEITSWTYDGAFTHNAWPNDTESHLYVTDEINGEPLKIFDITNLASPQLVNAITSNPAAIVHNAHVRGDELHLSNYTEGIRLLDISDPAHPAEIGYADSYPGPSGGYFGVWEVCPFFPSGTVIASDMQTGLYVYRPDRTNYGIIRAEVVDGGSLLPIEGAEVFLLSPAESLITTAAGVARFGPSPGSRTVVARLFGYTEAMSTVNVTPGSRDTVVLQLTPKALVSWSGTVLDLFSSNPLPTTDVVLAYTPLAASADALGAFSLADVPDDLYRVEVRSPGHIPLVFERSIGPGFPSSQTIALAPADPYDDLESASGWTVGAPGDDATSGLWVRVEPLGTQAPNPAPLARRSPALELAERDLPAGPAGTKAPAHEPETPALEGQIQPELDRTPDPGQMCFVTGQGTLPNGPGEADLDNGRTSLVSPLFDVSSMADPYVGLWKWFYTDGAGDGAPEDWFAVLVSNDGGTSYVPVDTSWTHAPRWEEFSFRVADYVAPTNQLRVKIVAADMAPSSIVEAAVDDVILWDAQGAWVGVGPLDPVTRLAFLPPAPNPAAGDVRLTLELPRAGEAEVVLIDVGGRRVRTLHRGAARAGRMTLHWDGLDDAGRTLPPGLYFARARVLGEVADTRIVRLP